MFGGRNRLVRAVIAASLAAAMAVPASAAGIISRAEWGAHKPVLPMTKQVPDRITIHHTAVRSKHGLSIVKKLQGLQNFSQSDAKLADGRRKKQWADVPYHFYISEDGKIAEGRPADFVGDTNTAYDPAGHLSIVVEGNFQKEQPTEAELASLASLTATLAKKYGIGRDRIGVHKDFAQTECPGKNLEPYIQMIIAALPQ
ncbi:peptidoglycan recognition protein family protein [Pararhizobium sp.]|uniref:peptidoglycan recognition protein family protein n=1 Tax=Pararhizobium sp. TaxID=1977563 RepID=UPI00271E966D|nr:peptidoglycan recognition family protein [Pararhizobium sp.]MDO9418603.1 peptidoglycan recognition family protein [Pararhizobium sp.]